MSAPQGVSFKDCIAGVQVPEVPTRNPVLEKDAHIANVMFSQKMQACLADLALYKPSNNDEKRVKKAKFVELVDCLSRFQKEFPEATTAMQVFQTSIKQSLDELKKSFKDTGSRYLKATMRGGGWEETNADERVELKINPYEIKPTLEEISLLPRPILKLRGLQLALKLIEAEEASITTQRKAAGSSEQQALKSKAMRLESSRRLVNQYAVYRLTAEETYEALAQIWARDANQEQDRDLKVLTDPSGRKWIAQHICSATAMESLTGMLCGTLKKHYFDNPAKTPLEHLLAWPDFTYIASVGIPQRRKFLLQLEIACEKQKDPFMLLIFEYLANVFDHTGNLRKEAIENPKVVDPKGNLSKDAIEKLKVANSFGFKCRKLAEVAVSLKRFNLDCKKFLEDVNVENPTLVELGTSLVHPFFPSDKALKKEEVDALAQAFRAEMVATFLAFNVDAFLSRDPVLKEINTFTEQFQTYCKAQLTSKPPEKVSKADRMILKNVIRFIERLSDIGEMTLSFDLFMSFVGSPRYTDAMPSKEFNGLKALFSPSDNFKEMRKSLKDFTEKNGKLCLPSLQLISKNCEGFRNQISRFRSIVLDNLGEKKLIQLYESVLGKDETEAYRKELASAMKLDEDQRVLPYGKLFNDWGKLLEKWKELGLDKDEELTAQLRECLDNEIGGRLGVEEQHRQLQVLQSAFNLYYHGYKRPPAMELALFFLKATTTKEEKAPDAEEKKS